ncbi:MAG: hypothetical protein MUC42_07525 [Bryobacter sp.]|jgi:hypothetical protein|nr:hypothetical protein [Bryobacter sp.]
MLRALLWLIAGCWVLEAAPVTEVFEARYRLSPQHWDLRLSYSGGALDPADRITADLGGLQALNGAHLPFALRYSPEAGITFTMAGITLHLGGLEAAGPMAGSYALMPREEPLAAHFNAILIEARTPIRNSQIEMNSVAWEGEPLVGGPPEAMSLVNLSGICCDRRAEQWVYGENLGAGAWEFSGVLMAFSPRSGPWAETVQFRISGLWVETEPLTDSPEPSSLVLVAAGLYLLRRFASTK